MGVEYALIFSNEEFVLDVVQSVLSFSTKCVSAKKSCSANSTKEKLQCLFHLVGVDIDLVQFPFDIKNYFSAKSFINISQSIILSAKYRVQNP